MKLFRSIFVMSVLIVIGAALILKLDTTIEPRPTQGKTITISLNWPNVPARIVEQNVTSVIEGLVSSVRDVAKTESVSRFGRSTVKVELKKNADVSSAKFEISSLMRQTRDRLPDGISYPIVSGGDIESSSRDEKKDVTLLTYRIANDMPANTLREYVKNRLEPIFTSIDEIKEIDVSGGTDIYLEVSYDPIALSKYGISSSELKEAVKANIGENESLGEVMHDGLRTAVWLVTDGREKSLEQIPIKQNGRNGETVYINDIATSKFKHKDPDRYYRINGQNTVYLNIIAEAGSNLISLSDQVQREISKLSQDMPIDLPLELTYDAAERQRDELSNLVGRSLLSLMILLALVLFVSRSWRYLCIIGITLAASILTAVIGYWLFDIRLHIYSLAGITVSLGLIIDASIVMVDHYKRYRNRGAYFGILAALLTTIGSLALIYFMPDYIRDDLLDFAWIVMINLTCALIVAYFFVPAMVEAFDNKNKLSGKPIKKRRGRRAIVRWCNHPYMSYIAWMRCHRWIAVAALVLAFGLPIFALPESWKIPGRDDLSKWLGGTLALFAESLDSNTYGKKRQEMKLNIRAKLPLGGTVAQLNEKVLQIDEFLKEQDGIRRWVTNVNSGGASIVVEFTPESLGSSLPYELESKTIGRVIDIGGADWSIYGVSERGFSNSINLAYRSNHISVCGYNYERTLRLSEILCDTLSRNPRVSDLAIQTPSQRNSENELYVEYNPTLMSIYGITPQIMHQSLKDILEVQKAGTIDDGLATTEVYISPISRNSYDLWQLNNSYLRIDSTDVRLGDFMKVNSRQAKNVIEKKNQEYVLDVGFNVAGSYNYTKKYIERVIENFNYRLPAGFSCQPSTYGWYSDTGQQYWLLAVVVLIIYFLCGILYESWVRPLLIISLIPVSFIGVFLAFWLTGVPFGTGGFASLVLLCGIVVNSGIYILCEYDGLKRGKKIGTAVSEDKGKNANGWHLPFMRAAVIERKRPSGLVRIYTRAYNRKIGAVMLTIISTVAGLIPFLIDGAETEFWHSFAVGTISGLIFSLFSLVLFMPIFISSKSAA